MKINRFNKSIRNKKKQKQISTKFMLLIMTLVCISAIFISLTFNISWTACNVTVAWICFVPMQKGIN